MDPSDFEVGEIDSLLRSILTKGVQGGPFLSVVTAILLISTALVGNRRDSMAPMVMERIAGAQSRVQHERGEMTTDLAFETERDGYLLGQVREAFGRVVYSHKTHEKQADLCFQQHRVQQTALVLFTAASTGTFLAALIGNVVSPQMASLVTSFVALVVTGLTLATKSFKFGEEAEAHRDIASRLWDVRESYLSLIADLMAGATLTVDARARRDELQEATRAAYADAPRTTARAFRQASSGLQANEEMTFTSQEIDQFLPEALRLNIGV